ncbi:MAG: efflux RND transporter periplasmic adaptor subunit [Bacteroidales bacterium]|nr:efflux RND transporter periplasmic adaptor subunit [Bacteroidales bacterium]
MKKTLIYIGVTVALIALVVFQLKNNKEATLERVYHYDKEEAIHVQTMKVVREETKNTYSYTGVFEPNKETKLSADIQGKIIELLVDVGSSVKKDQPLIQLDNSLLKLQLESVEIQIEGLEKDVKRYTILAKADAIQGVQLEKTELALKSAKVQKATLIEQIDKSTIKAPFKGIVTAKFTEVGSFAAPGMPLLQITDISALKFSINVPEDELNMFGLKHNYELTADVYPETKLSGSVYMTGSKANMGNSFPVQFLVKNTDDLKIKSGMFGKVLFDDEFEGKQISIPASSIIGTNIQPQVYVVKEGKAYLQNVIIATRFQNKVVISKGLSEGDIIITNGFINLFEGANVLISK